MTKIPPIVKKPLTRGIILALIAGIGISLLSRLNPTRFVENGQNLVVFSWFEGVKPQPLEPGFHLVTPIITSTYPFDVKTQALTWKDEDATAYSGRLVALSQDGQEIRSEVTLQFRVMDAPKVFNTFGDDYIDRIAPIVRSVIVSETAAFSAQDLYSTKRPVLQARIREKLVTYLEPYGISVLDLLLRDVSFNPNFVQAIEAKTIAENQLAQKSFEIEQAKQDARTTIAQAEADAGKLKAKANALTNNPQYLDVIKAGVYGQTLDILVTK